MYKKRVHTELGEEEQEHNNGGGNRDDATGEGTAVEILIDFGVCIQIPKLAHYIIHLFFFLDLKPKSVSYISADKLVPIISQKLKKKKKKLQ